MSELSPAGKSQKLAAEKTTNAPVSRYQAVTHSTKIERETIMPKLKKISDQLLVNDLVPEMILFAPPGGSLSESEGLEGSSFLGTNSFPMKEDG